MSFLSLRKQLFHLRKGCEIKETLEIIVLRKIHLVIFANNDFIRV